MKLRTLIMIGLVLLFVIPITLKLAESGAILGANSPPIASFSYDPLIPAPEDTISFDASASYDPDGWIVSYQWDFGDGNTTATTGSTITHSYPVDGTYTVELVVTDNSGTSAVSVAVVEISTEVYFRVSFYGTLIPMANVKVTMYYDSGTGWVAAPVGSCQLEIRYDNMTQPDLADTPDERFRNPGFTASLLRKNASNIGFDIHPSNWYVYFKFEYGDIVSYWPNETTRVYTYKDGTIEAHDYSPSKGAHWDADAGTYVIKAKNIPSNGVSPTQNHPIIMGVFCPPQPTRYYLTVRTDPSGVATIPGEGWYNKDENVTLTAPQYIDVSPQQRYRFSYWDVDGTSQGYGVNPIAICMNTNHTATANYVTQYLVTFSQTGLSSDATGTIVIVNGSSKTYGQLPYSLWVDSGSAVAYSYTSTVSSSTLGKRFRLNSVSGPPSPFTATVPVVVAGNYVTQYVATFSQTGIGSPIAGTIVTVNGAGKSYPELPYSLWTDYGSTVVYSYTSTIQASSDMRYKLDNVTGPPPPITVTAPTFVVGNYVVQYLTTFTQTGLDSSATGTVVTVDGAPQFFADLPHSDWFESGSSITYAFNNVSSTILGKRFILTSVSGIASPIVVTSSVTVTGNYKTQYLITFDQTGVGSDFSGMVIMIDSANLGISSLPVDFWWDKDSSHSFEFWTPLVVNVTRQYAWSSTSGLTTLRAGMLTVTDSGNVIGNYVVQNWITFDQVGVGSDYVGTIVTVDGISYSYSNLPKSFYWSVGSVHNYSFQSPLIVAANVKQYSWTSTSGLSSVQSGNITVTGYGSIVGHYKTQYYLNLASNPSGLINPSGSGWHDAGTHVPILTNQYVLGVTRWRFDGWTTADMSEIADPSLPSTTVFMDKGKTVTANYVLQYEVTFTQTGVGSDFTGTIVKVDGTDYNYSMLPQDFWWDSGSSHDFSFMSPLIVNISRQYSWTSTTGLTAIQNGTLTVTSSGSITGNYITQNKHQITFSQTGVDTDFDNVVVAIDGVHYSRSQLPYSFWWLEGTNHTFGYVSPLIQSPNFKQYVWSSSTGLSPLQSGTITVTVSGSVAGNYKTQYYLTLATSPPGITSPLGSGWHDSGANATISTEAFVNLAPGSRYRFNGWTTANMSEIADPSRSPTTVLMDEGKTVTANYLLQYEVIFMQAGVGSDFTGTVLTVDGTNFSQGMLSYSYWWDNGTSHAFTFHAPLVVTANAKQYNWTITTGLASFRTGTLHVLAAGDVTGHYSTQYYLTVSSPYGGPSPTSRWYNAGTSVTASVTTPWPGPAGTRYLCTGWTGTGSVPPSGTGSSLAFTINLPSSIAWNWKTQYLLTVITNPSGLSPQPARNPLGELGPSNSWWYNSTTSVNLNAQNVTSYIFDRWNIDGTPQGSMVNPISITMNAPHNATANYTQAGPLAVSISPLSTTIYLGQSATFASSVSGGVPPYAYHWYLDSYAVSNATSNSWVFTPNATGTYYVHLRVQDSQSNTAQSQTAKVTVVTPPVGGYAVSTTKSDRTICIVAYALLIGVFATGLSLKKRKRK